LAHTDIAKLVSVRMRLTSVQLHLAELNIFNYGFPIDLSLIGFGGCNTFTLMKRNK